MSSTNFKNEGITNLPLSGYADDLILFTQSQTDLQKATNLLDQIFERFDLKETMVLNNEINEYSESIITVINTAIKNGEKFKYLGAYIKHDQPNTGDVELNYRIQMATSKFVEISTL